ncbi:5-bromo-4-chloroindolyl phosphate hydrolysis family protein [Hydrogenimonas urashimensis]|uniref:5-bromo-4-chloroindolyl phosphate hydrolysis family protein n=1 Tax=Hydrogenimonas urashimensis TaxID=2740515 RepID=UPI001915FB07|nr:5-bromo-4-chloroindolyl phosphate hydrolysis family protein [Hydrogenimonas urashimensis]
MASGRDAASGATRPWMLYFFAPFLLMGVASSLVAGHYRFFLFKLAGFGLYYVAIRCIERGNRMAFVYEKAAIAPAPRPPCRTIGSGALFSAVTFLGTTVTDASWLQSLVVGTVTAAGALLYYGTDPVRDKLPDSDADIDTSHLLASLKEARERLKAIDAAKRSMDDPRLAALLGETLRHAERILHAIEQDPALLRLARKFLVVYIDGIARVMERYAQLKTKGIDEKTRENLAALLEEANRRFEAERQRLDQGDRFDLEVQIDAMRELLKQ